MKINVMNIYKKIALFFKRTFMCFSFIIVLMSVVGEFFFAEETMKIMSTSQILTFLLYSVLFGLSFFVADYIKDNAIIKNTVRFLLSFASLIAIVLFGGSFESFSARSSTDNPGFTYLVFLGMVFVSVYVICALLIVLKNFIVNKLTNSNKNYNSLFSEDN